MKKNRFTITNPKIIYWLLSIIIIFFIVLLILNTIFTPPPHHAMYITISLIVFIPCTVTMMWTKLYKITVDENKIIVRRGYGFQYTFDVSEIVKVDWKIVETKIGRNEIIRIKIGYKHFSVETPMDGFEKMSVYIKKNVDSSKIFIRNKNFI